MRVSGSVVLPGVVERLGGREVHWVHQPGTGPAVVLLGGCGVPFYTWDAVVELLPDATLARMDRPGLGGTAWPGQLPTLQDEVATLADLVRRLGGRAIVVGHSMAGPHAEALARHHPELVAGLVLVDASVEWAPKRPGSGEVWLQTARATRALMWVPPLRPLGSLADRVLTATQSRRRFFDPTSALAKEVYRTRDAAASVIAEQAAYNAQLWDLAEVRAGKPLPPVSAVVLTAAGDGGAKWVADQRRLAELLGGSHVVAEDSRHLIMLDRPDLVADAVTAVRSAVAEGH